MAIGLHWGRDGAPYESFCLSTYMGLYYGRTPLHRLGKNGWGAWGPWGGALELPISPLGPGGPGACGALMTRPLVPSMQVARAFSRNRSSHARIQHALYVRAATRADARALRSGASQWGKVWWKHVVFRVFLRSRPRAQGPPWPMRSAPWTQGGY